MFQARRRPTPLSLPLATCIAAVALASTACRNGLTEIDAQATALVERSQALTLGPNATHDPARTPSRSTGPYAADLAAFDEPTTLNPAVDDLPVRAAKPRADVPTAGQAPAPTPGDPEPAPDIELNLEGALRHSITHSREYLNEKEELFIAALAMLWESHLWGPRFFNTFSTQLAGAPSGNDTAHALEFLNRYTVSQRLPNGGAVSASALVNYVDRMRSGEADPSDGQGAGLSLDLELPLLRGAGAVAREPLIQAKRDLVYAVRQFERFRRSFLFEVSTDYFGLLLQQTNIENLKRQLANLEWLHKRIEALAQAGREAPFEVQRVGQQVLFARNNLTEANESYEAALDRFKVRLGIPPGRRLRILPSDVQLPLPELDPADSVETAQRLRLDLQTARDQVDDARRAVEVARNATQGDLDVNASIDLRTDPRENFGGVDLQASASRYALGLTYGAPLDRQRERIDYRRSVIRLEQARRSHDLARDQVAQEVRRSVRQIELAQDTLSQQNRNIDIAQKRLRGVVLRLRTLGPRDFIEAQDDLLEAQTRRDAALRDLRVSILRYLVDTEQMRVDSDGVWDAPAKLSAGAPPPEIPKAAELLLPQEP